MILYRDIYVYRDIINNAYHYTLGKNKDVFLKIFSSINSLQTDNFNIHDMT